MNENSWLYYTDWFWYLGWFEFRFKIRELKWLDARLAPSEQGAAFMSLTLEKTPTTIAERMTARTMRPDFGGLIDPIDAPCHLPPNPHPHRPLADGSATTQAASTLESVMRRIAVS